MSKVVKNFWKEASSKCGIFDTIIHVTNANWSMNSDIWKWHQNWLDVQKKIVVQKFLSYNFPNGPGDKRCKYVRNTFWNIQIWFSLETTKDVLTRRSMKCPVWNVLQTSSFKNLLMFPNLTFFESSKESVFSTLVFCMFLLCSAVSFNLNWDFFFFFLNTGFELMYQDSRSNSPFFHFHNTNFPMSSKNYNTKA